MTPTGRDPETLLALRSDLAYHQMRVLLLVDAVAGHPGHNRKLDGLTKLAKLDFLVRYPALAPRVLDALDANDRRLHLPASAEPSRSRAETPMMRYKYGPWDDRYYPVIGALVGRGLLRYSRGRQGSVALVPTPAGHGLGDRLRRSPEWTADADRCQAVAEASAGLTGNALKELIYRNLPEIVDRPQRQVIA